MNAKLFITVITLFSVSEIGYAQNRETTDSLTKELQEIVVTSNRPSTKLVGTTLVTTVPGSNLADLGNSLDVLSQLPMIKVEDNTVSVIGKSNIEIYIDGKPMRDELELQQLLSSNLKKVELLMEPGAAYESTTDAVIKITTKRNFIQGLSLTDQLRVQRRRKWSITENLGLSYRLGGWEFFIDGNINHNNSVAKGSTINSLVYNGDKTVVGSSQYNSYPSTTGVVKTGFNYAEGPQSFGAYYRYNPEHGSVSNSGAEWLDDSPAVIRNIDKHIKAYSHQASVYYDNTFAGHYLLHFDGDYRRSHADNRSVTTYPSSDNHDVRSADENSSTLLAGKLYLNFPLWAGDFTIGTLDSYTRTKLDYRMLNHQIEEYIPSALTEASQTSAALFATWSRMFGHLTLSAGARYEYVDYDFKVDGRKDEDVSRRDHLLTPDISVGYAINDDTQLTASYRMATLRPPYSGLTGSLTYVGMHEIEGGNPGLRDEKMHNVQLSGLWKGFMLQADYIRSFDTYAYVKQPYRADNLQLIMHPVNINLTAMDLYLIWSQPVKKWTPSVTVGMYRQWLNIGHTRHNRPIFSYYFDNTFGLPYGWLVTANFSGQTEGDMHTNRFGSTWLTMDASIGKTFFGKSLTVRLSATDIFNSQNNDWTMDTYGVFVDKRQSYDRRGVSINIIYNFQPYKSKYKGAAASEAELRRL